MPHYASHPSYHSFGVSFRKLERSIDTQSVLQRPVHIDRSLNDPSRYRLADSTTPHVASNMTPSSLVHNGNQSANDAVSIDDEHKIARTKQSDELLPSFFPFARWKRSKNWESYRVFKKCKISLVEFTEPHKEQVDTSSVLCKKYFDIREVRCRRWPQC